MDLLEYQGKQLLAGGIKLAGDRAEAQAAAEAILGTDATMLGAAEKVVELAG